MIASLMETFMLLCVAAREGFAGLEMGMQIERIGVLARQAGSENLQTFTGTLGGAADPITRTGDTREPFAVDGSTFTDLSDAVTRSCNNQHNTCARLANSKTSAEGGGGGTTVAECDAQQSSCIAAGGTSIASGANANSTSSEPASASGGTSTTPSEVVVTSTSTETSGSVVVVTVGTTATGSAVLGTATATLEGSDENFFFFCDA
ncbi:hypothetical protein M430DRAFT_43192 [Amorphotheca resinae ATCC 22711]|uniref:Uncharacterized protein n=1 Tax=Amorphotheca resinae ATCC 22711 TaxID=857342 RepID=A0A2T3AXV6_AMORE|nr:hypothetical protein M430DRAFT_43192 [Amorphotheca resinae ATCC 22711]PSS14906.1 hypothetical protein M430DRAFT_43192 [Amorphotheca resinae ATCC 22711]